METIFFDKQTKIDAPVVASIGFFDGVHKGHQYVIQQLQSTAKRKNCSSMIITFDRHPRQVVATDYTPELLTTTEERLSLLQNKKVDYCVVLPFTTEMAKLTADKFAETILKQLNVKTILMGYDNRFGARGTQLTQNSTIETIIATPMDINIDNEKVRVSSSVIRRIIAQGKMEQASTMLGRPYTIKGTVIEGDGRGRLMGFPTANINPIDKQKLIPPPGVYAVDVKIIDTYTTTNLYKGMMNIGTRPTFNGTTTTYEINIFDFEGNLYGKQLEVAFDMKLRDERHFQTTEELVNQLHDDRRKAKNSSLRL